MDFFLSRCTQAWPALAALALLTAPITAPMTAAAGPAEKLLHFHAGEDVAVYGQTYHATRAGTAYVSLSSEYVSVAVLQGKLKSRHIGASAGDILVAPIESGAPERFMFDAAILARTLDPAALVEAGPLLEPIIARQKRQRFFGLVEPVGLNARNPAPAPVEAMRRGYLSPDLIVDLRGQAGGDIDKLNTLTALRFIAAVAAKSESEVAALIDPKPFTDATADPSAWQAARDAFAGQLVAQPGLSDTIATLHMGRDPDNAGAWILDNGVNSLYRLRLVTRDRAAFVAALEAL